MRMNLKRYAKLVLFAAMLIIALSSYRAFATDFDNALSFDGTTGNSDFQNAETIEVGETKSVDVLAGEMSYLKFAPEVSGTYMLASDSVNDTIGYLYDENMNELDCNDDYEGSVGFCLVCDLIADENYFFGMKFCMCDQSGSITVTLTAENVECDHRYVETYRSKSATCTKDGTQEMVCSFCGHICTRKLSAPGHNYSSDWTIDEAATCTETGSQSHHCTRCDAKSDITEIKATGHKYSKWTTTKKATCTEKGSQKRTCSVCGRVSTRSLSALGHNYSSDWTIDTKATCTKTGSQSHHCTRCDAKKNVTTIKATGHKYKTTVTTKATTSKNGTKTTKCSACGYSYKKTIAKISSVKLSYTSYTYNGNTKTPTVTVKDSNGNTLKKDTDYTVKYSSGRKNVGKYTVTVTFKGSYSGTKTLTFKINPKGTSISKLTAGTKKFTAAWTKQSTQVSGYQLQYSTSSKMTNAKSKTISGASKTSLTVSELKAGTKYYVRIRTYKNVTIDGKVYKYYSSWSSVKSVKTK